MTTCHGHLTSGFPRASANYIFEAWCENVLYIPDEGFEQLAGVVVRIQDFRLGRRCLYRDGFFKAERKINKNSSDEIQKTRRRTSCSRLFKLPVCFCRKSPATRHLADSMVLTMLVERTLKMGEKTNRLWEAAGFKRVKTDVSRRSSVHQNLRVRKRARVSCRPSRAATLTRPPWG